MRWFHGKAGWAPSAIIGDYFIEADPTNTYTSSETGLFQGVIWLDASETGGGTAVDYDSGVSLTFINVAEDITVFSDDDSPSGAYVQIDWAGTLAVGSVTTTVEFYDASVALIDSFSDVNDIDSQMSVFFDHSVSVPAGGAIRVTVKHTGTPTTFSYGGELAFRYSQP